MKILLIGLGSVGKKHLKAVKSIYPHAEVYAFRSGKSAETNPDVINIYDLKEIETTTIDFAIIANPTSEHKRSIGQVTEYRLPVFIEKPVYYSLDIEGLIRSINTKGIITYVACNLRFLDCIKYVKEKLPHLNKKLNEVNVYCGSYLPDWRTDKDFRKTYSTITELGGGVHLDLIHELDYLYWLFGKPAEVERNFRSQSSLAVSSFDYANYILDYDGFCASVVLNYYRRDSKRCLELVFEDETWYVDLLKNQILCKNEIVFQSSQRIVDTYKVQMEYFIKCLYEKTNTFNTISDAYEVLKICLDQ